jgi:nucleotide-binding universal stress UspA family protein
MIKSILIPLDPSPYTDAAIRMACELAKIHDARLSGLVILDIEGIERHIGPVPLGASYYADKLEEQHKKHAQKRIDSLIENFKIKCNSAGVNYTVAQNQGSPSERILQESMFYDMIITGLRTYFNFETSNEPGDSLSDLLHESVTPILGVPKEFNFPDLTKEKLKVLLPFNASLQSARALQRFAQFLRPEIAVPRLLMSSDDEKIALASLEHAKDYLQIHGFKEVKTEWTRQNILETCEQEGYIEWADIVVVGSHSKRGLFNFMVGSLTKCLIKRDKVPVVVGQ